MNPNEANASQEMEARITALLLGELPAQEATELRNAMSQDPALAHLHEQLSHTIALVRETTANSQGSSIPGPVPRRLSGPRREQLLRAFKIVKVEELAKSRRRELPWYIPMGIAAALVALIGTLLLSPGLASRSTPIVLARRDLLEKAKAGKPATAASQLATSRQPEVGHSRAQGEDLAISQVASAKQRDSEIPEKYRPYFHAKRDLDTEQRIREAIRRRIIQEAAAQPELLGIQEAQSSTTITGVKSQPPVPESQLQAGATDPNAPVAEDAVSPITSAPVLPAGTLLSRADREARDGPSLAEADLSKKLSELDAKTANDAFSFAKDGSLSQKFDRSKQAEAKAPVLGDQPLVGRFFGEPERSQQKESAAPAEVPGLVTQTAQSSSMMLGLEPPRGPVESQPQAGVTVPNAPATEAMGRFAYAVPPPGTPPALPADARPALTDGEARDGRGLGTAAFTRELAEIDAKAVNGTVSGEGLERRYALEPRLAARYGLLSKKQESLATNGLLADAANRLIDQAGKAELKQQLASSDRFDTAAKEEYKRSVRVDLSKDSSDGSALLYGIQQPSTLDPYFVQTENEKIKSKSVLYRVIDQLKLNEAWSKKEAGNAPLSVPEAYQRLKQNVEVSQSSDGEHVDIRVQGEDGQEAARIAKTIGDVYQQVRQQERARLIQRQTNAAPADTALASQGPSPTEPAVRLRESERADAPLPKPAATAAIPQPELETRVNAFSTFSLNVTDVSFRLAGASLEKGQMPDPASVRSEEFINAFDYHDPAPAPPAPIGFTWERARYPFAQDRDVLRFSVKTAAQGRPKGYPLNLVLLLDKSGSMERADRVQIVREALRVLAGQLQPMDRLSIVTLARTARLWADGIAGGDAGQAFEQVAGQTPEGGTNLEEALRLAYETALRHFIQAGGNRVVLLTDGAANLGNVDPTALLRTVEAERKLGIALDCFGIGWEGFNDNLLEVLSSHGDGRYSFLNTPEEATTQFGEQLAGALHVAAADVKVQVQFNPKRVLVYRQIGYAQHQLTKEQFRDNTVDAAELGAAESGNALYLVQVDTQGEGDLATVRVRYKEPSTAEYHEQAWAMPYDGAASSLEKASPALRLATAASAFSEWLVSSPFADEVSPDRLLIALRGVPEAYGTDARPKKLEWMIRQAKSLSGK